MTIAMIGQKGLPARSGGIERHVDILAQGLVSRGHRVIVFGRSWYVQNRSIENGVEQILTSGIRTKHLDAITHGVTALWRLRKIQPDVVHLHGTGVALLTPIARLVLPRSKIVVTFHCIDRVLAKWNTFAKFAFRIGEWLACQMSHRTIAVSQELARYCHQVYGAQTVYVSHPLPLPEIEKDLSYLENHQLKQDKYFLFVGRLIPDKQAHRLVEAYQLALKKRPDIITQYPLVLVGGASWTDRYARWLCGVAARAPGVFMLGERTGRELQSLQAHALCHVFPTMSEGLSLAVIEACQLQRPIIASNISANLEATGGYMHPVPVGDVEALSDALIHVATLNSSERLELARKAYEYVACTNHLDDRLDDFARVYLQIVHGSHELVSPVSV